MICNDQAIYFRSLYCSVSPPWVGGKPKGLEKGKEKEGGKKRKKASKLQSPTGDCNF